VNLTLDLHSDVPIYQQIRDRVIEQIAMGEARRGDPLPSTRQLAADFGINFHTVNKAYDLLRREGVIRINRKSGAVIHKDQHYADPVDEAFVRDWRERMRVLLAEATVQGVHHQDVLVHCAELLATFKAGEDV
jgi:DNA-binding transcriptional regulator YhcF (GntR family)